MTKKAKKTPTEMVGATRASFTLNSPVTHASFAAKPKAAKRGAAACSGAAPCAASS